MFSFETFNRRSRTQPGDIVIKGINHRTAIVCLDQYLVTVEIYEIYGCNTLMDLTLSIQPPVLRGD